VAESLGYAPALFAASGLRFLGAALFVLLGVGVVAAAPTTRPVSRA
jgi:hypothetical protein